MTVVVIGASGQLAQHLQQLLPVARFLSRADADLNNPVMLRSALLEASPSCIVNAAAYTAVDRAESEADVAWAVNAEAPALMARIANALSVPLLHVSTDYVFDGHGDTPWHADDAVNPPNVYGRTKLAGEMAIKTLCSRHWILRTSWVFSEHGNNFVKTILRLARERPELRIVDDQRGRPTYAGDLAGLIARLALEPNAETQFPFGIHHATGGPVVSWCEFAEAIVKAGYRAGLLSRHTPIVGIRTVEYPTPAKRPANSVLEPSTDLPALGGITFDWQSGLDRTVSGLRRLAA